MDNFESLFFHFETGLDYEDGLGTHLLITNIGSGGLKDVFVTFLQSRISKHFDYSASGNKYDTLIVTGISSPADLHRTLLNNNGKIIVFDCEKVLANKHYTNLLEGAICSSPDSCSKWSVSYTNQKEFIFTGRCIILTKFTLDELKKLSRMEYILRDSLKYGN